MAQFSKFGCITLLFNLFQLCNKSLFRRDGLIGIRGEFYVINQCALRFGWEKSNQRFAQSCRVGRLAGADGAGGKPCVFCDIFGNARNQPGNIAAPIGFETPDDMERTALATQPGIPDNAGNPAQRPEGSPEDTPQEYLPEVENMEGAAFFAVCDALDVACCQIRAVSNYVGEPFGQWAVEEAVGNLTEKLNQIFESNE